MTPEAQRIAIAEACGWQFPHGTTITHASQLCRRPSGDWATLHSELPNYLNDLNAMHEAEKTLTDEQYHRPGGYIDKLNDVVADGPMERVPTAGGSSVLMPTIFPRWMSPTAAQRAEAFLRTLGLYVEESGSRSGDRESVSTRYGLASRSAVCMELAPVVLTRRWGFAHQMARPAARIRVFPLLGGSERRDPG